MPNVAYMTLFIGKSDIDYIFIQNRNQTIFLNPDIAGILMEKEVNTLKSLSVLIQRGEKVIKKQKESNQKQ